MHFEVSHLTRYSYASSVFLGTQTLRLKPRTDANQRLLRYSLHVTPEPESLTEVSDIGGATSTHFFLSDLVSDLTIEVHSLVETLRPNPFDYLWQGNPTLPMRYDEALEKQLQPFRAEAPDPYLRQLVDSVAADVDGDAQAFPRRLAWVLHERVAMIVRPEGEPLPPEATLAAGEGSCRDVALLFMAVCREAGYAARFVSGYHAVDTDEHDLHAWAEVYVPGGGWRGFDPTVGIAVADRHIALVAAADPSLAAPVSGTFRSRASSRLETQVNVRTLDEAEL